MGRLTNAVTSISFEQTFVTFKGFSRVGVDEIRGSSTYLHVKLKVQLPTSKTGVLVRTDLYLLLALTFH